MVLTREEIEEFEREKEEFLNLIKRNRERDVKDCTHERLSTKCTLQEKAIEDLQEEIQDLQYLLKECLGGGDQGGRTTNYLKPQEIREREEVKPPRM